MKNQYTFQDFQEIVKRLRGEGGCPWDRKQTLLSMKPYLLEETREVMEGIDIFQKTGQWDNLCEELGDVLYNVLMQCEIANEMGIFTINDVIQGISEKMIRRHPKVFASEKGANDNSSIEQSWEEIKAQEKLMKSGKANERGKSQDNSRERQQMT